MKRYFRRAVTRGTVERLLAHTDDGPGGRTSLNPAGARGSQASQRDQSSHGGRHSVWIDFIDVP